MNKISIDDLFEEEFGSSLNGNVQQVEVTSHSAEDWQITFNANPRTTSVFTRVPTRFIRWFLCALVLGGGGAAVHQTMNWISQHLGK